MEIKEYPSGGRLLGGAWTTIFRRGVKQSNEWCNLHLTNNQLRAENSRRMHSLPFFRGAGECKFPECNVKVKFVIKKEIRKYVHVTYVGNVYHKLHGSPVAKKWIHTWWKKHEKKLLERASCLGLQEINELVECWSREYLPRGRQSVRKPKHLSYYFSTMIFKVLWKEYISHVKKYQTILQNFWLSQKSNCSDFSDNYDRRIIMLSKLTNHINLFNRFFKSKI